MTELENRLYREITRRTLLKAAGASALSLSAAALLDACDIRGTSNANTGKITIGYVSPQTGEAAGFATGDNYVINGNMIGGFALVAWPAAYGSSGVMTFIVNQQGRVYQKDLGPGTANAAGTMKEYNPDKTWTVSAD